MAKNKKFVIQIELIDGDETDDLVCNYEVPGVYRLYADECISQLQVVIADLEDRTIQ